MGAAIASLIEGNGVIAPGGKKRQDLAPGVGEFRKAVDKNDELGVGRGFGGQRLEDVEYQAMRGGVNVAGCHTSGQVDGWQRPRVEGIHGRVLVSVRHNRQIDQSGFDVFSHAVCKVDREVSSRARDEEAHRCGDQILSDENLAGLGILK